MKLFNLVLMGFVFTLSLISAHAFANTYVKCGKTADPETLTVSGYEIEISSEGNDDYSGPVEGKWNLKVGSESSDWMKEDPKVTAKNYKMNNDVIIEIRMESMFPNQGTTYKLVGLYSATPTLEKYTYGEAAGIQKINSFKCVSAND